MNSDQSDRKLARLFSNLRSGDAAGAPAFSEIAGTGRPATRYTVRWPRIAAAAAVVAVVGAALALSHRPAAPGIAPDVRANERADDLRAPVMKTPQIAATKTSESTVDSTQWAAVPIWAVSTDSLLTVCNLPLGSTVTTMTDSLFSAASDGADTTSANGKESL